MSVAPLLVPTVAETALVKVAVRVMVVPKGGLKLLAVRAEAPGAT